MITERVKRLLEKVKSFPERVIRDRTEQYNYMGIMHRVYSKNKHLPEVLRRAEFLQEFASQVSIKMNPDELIVGSQQFTGGVWESFLKENKLPPCRLHNNIGHICVDYERVLRLGVRGLQNKISQMPDSDNKKAFTLALEAFSNFIKRHNCEKLSEYPPDTFHEALQLLWFTQIFLHAEGNGAAAVSFGRFDQYMAPFLETDLQAGKISEKEAFELLCCFSLKCCEGDESQNLILGGKENKLSIMILKVMTELQIYQPSISVRISSDTSEEFWDASLKLCSSGIGMPSFFNEPVVTEALEKLDIPSERAKDWGIVGCYEASPQGDCYPLTVGGGFTLPSILWDFLQTKSEWKSFDLFYKDFKTFFIKQYHEVILPSFEERWHLYKKENTSPFESICLTGCIESGLAAEEGGTKFNLFGVNILGLGTLIDSLLSIKELIFISKDLSFEQIKQELEDNFPDKKLLSRCRNLPNKFGTDSQESNELVKDLSSFIAEQVINKPMKNGVQPYPGFFWFGQDIFQEIMASPDGRLANERISYGCGPGEFLSNKSATSILNSVANVDHKSCACGNPLMLTLNKKDIKGENGRKRIRQLIESYFQKGGFHLQFNIMDVKELEDAKINPEKYHDLIVRISGFSANFTGIEAPWQDALIERSKAGI